MSVIRNRLLAVLSVLTVCMLTGLAMAQDPAAAPAAPAASDASAAAASGGGQNFAQMFLYAQGSWFGTAQIWLLVIMSIATVALVIHYILANRRITIVPADAVSEIEALLSEKKYREAIEVAEAEPSIFGQIMNAALSEASNGYGAMERAVEESADLESTKRSRSLVYLDVLGATGPMIGLFGTVYGMIVAFQTIVASAGKPTPEALAAGISTALVTTLWGLVVGIPAVAAAALIRNTIDGLTTEAMVEAEALIGRFKPGAAKKEKSSSSSDTAVGVKSPMATPKPKAE